MAVPIQLPLPGMGLYDYSQGMPPRPEHWDPIPEDEMNVGDLSSGIYDANAAKRYVSVPEGMRETISDASYNTERDLGYDYPGYDQVRNPQQHYMENRPEYGYDQWWEGPINTTGRRPDDGGFIEYQEPYPHMESYVGRQSQADFERYPFLAREYEYNPLLQRALISRNRKNLYEDEGSAAIDKGYVQTDSGPITMYEALEREDALKKRIAEDKAKAPLDTSRFQDMYWGPSSEEDEEVVSEGITKGDRWRNFLSKITRQPYRPAMGGVTMGSGQTYSPAQLNKMNALGGWYSEPSRAVRRTQKRIENMVARREAGKSYSQKNLEAFTGRDEGRGSPTATPTRSASAAAAQGIDVRATGMMGPGGRHYMRGGRVGYNTGGRVGILSIF